ncbi:MAG: hypothetical protein QG616_1707 [Pseudomonadota bacterium]|nr:hypothetical protein [Pseudomonadota bacterium]MDQ5881875.1 hypothetical protein [Pseudomonadota bacterium]
MTGGLRGQANQVLLERLIAGSVFRSFMGSLSVYVRTENRRLLKDDFGHLPIEIPRDRHGHLFALVLFPFGAPVLAATPVKMPLP